MDDPGICSIIKDIEMAFEREYFRSFSGSAIAVGVQATSELLRLSPSISASSKVEHIVDAAALRRISEHRSVGTHSRSA